MKMKLRKKVTPVEKTEAPKTETSQKTTEKKAPAKTSAKTKMAEKKPAGKDTHDWDKITELAKGMVNALREIEELKTKYNEMRKEMACEKYNHLVLGNKYEYRTDKRTAVGVLRYRTSYEERNDYFELQLVKKDGTLSDVVRVVLDPDCLTLVE